MRALRCALYVRVSTTDRDQDPETQLIALREQAQAKGWIIHDEYVDHVAAHDLLHRREWQRLSDDAADRRFKVILVFRLDRAFRSLKHMHDTLEEWGAFGVRLRTAQENFESSTVLGRLLLKLLPSLAEFELEVMSERVRADADRSLRQGKHVGRPRVTSRPGFAEGFKAVKEEMQAGSLGMRAGARRLGIGPATLGRLLASECRSENGRELPLVRYKKAASPDR